MATHYPRTKVQIIRALSDRTNLPQVQVAKVLSSLADLAYEGAKDKHGFNLPRIGKLVLVHNRKRNGVNPRTGEKITIPAKVTVKFRVSKIAINSVLEKL